MAQVRGAPVAGLARSEPGCGAEYALLLLLPLLHQLLFKLLLVVVPLAHNLACLSPKVELLPLHVESLKSGSVLQVNAPRAGSTRR